MCKELLLLLLICIFQLYMAQKTINQGFQNLTSLYEVKDDRTRVYSKSYGID